MSAPVKLIDYCDEHQIPYFYLNISYITTPDGKTKKEISSLPKGYMTMDYSAAMKKSKPVNPTHINIILRNSPGKKLVVIDTDAPDAYSYITGLETLNQTAITTNIARQGHSHFYYEVPTLPAKKIIKTSDKKDIDLIIDNIFEKVDAEFTRLPAQLELAEITNIFGVSGVSSVSGSSNQPSKTTNTRPTRITTAKKITTLGQTDTNSPDNSTTPHTIGINIIEKMVNGLNPEEYKTYPKWIKLP